MNLKTYKVERLQELNDLLNIENENLVQCVRLAEIKNKWFTQENVWQMINAIKANYLEPSKLTQWMDSYALNELNASVGIICAGNIPLVGFHDILCAFVVNAPTQVKLASKDEVLMKFIIEQLQTLDITWQVEIVNRLQNYKAVIATGSDNSHRYFEQYFQSVPNILRSNRNSIAILTGDETAHELDLLAHDVLAYFGLGCRNVSKLLLPEGFDITMLFAHFDNFKEYVNHNLYKDNYDYNRTLLLMNLDKHLANDFIIAKEDDNLHSRLATIHYSFYKNNEEVQDYIIEKHENLQVVVSRPSTFWESVDFGQAQQPSLSDYADNIDTLEFLLSL
ncbi:MAG: acyl-CoA reductase [Chitinophagales bacterium]|nr:acyl-CoA reductase [Chitinophagales bacterium]